MCSLVMVNTPEIDPTYLTDDQYRRLMANALQTPDAIDMPYMSLQTPNSATITTTAPPLLHHQSVIHPLSAITTSDNSLLDLSQRSAAAAQQSVIITSQTQHQSVPAIASQHQSSSLPVLSPSVYQYLQIGAPIRAPAAHSSSAYIQPVLDYPTTPDIVTQMFRTPNPDAYRVHYGGRKSSSTASATFTPTASGSQSLSTSSESIESIADYKPDVGHHFQAPQFERRHSLYGFGSGQSYMSGNQPAFPTLSPSESCPPRFCHTGAISPMSTDTIATSPMGVNTMTTSSTITPSYTVTYATPTLLQDTSSHVSYSDYASTSSATTPMAQLRPAVITALDTMSSPGISGVEELDKFLNDRKYLEFRHKNNMASKKFRNTKRSKQKQMEEQIRHYVDDNKKCHELIAKMEKEIEFCKKILFKNFRRTDSPSK